MRVKRTRPDKVGPKPRRIFRIDAVLLAFLTVGWSLIFISATLGLRRNYDRWPEVEFLPRVSADYSVDEAQAQKLAPVRPQIVEAVRQDALVSRPQPSPVAVAAAKRTTEPLSLFGRTPVPTLTPTPTPTLLPGPSGLNVSAGGPYTGKEGSPVLLVAKAASLLPENVTFRWDLDNDGRFDDADGISASAVFYDEGEYPIAVQATDLIGRTASDATIVTVSNVAPVLDAGGNRYAEEGQGISFLARASDPGQDVLLYYWDFGDGTQTTGTLNPGHIYLDNGDYLVRVRVEDNDGGIAQASFLTYVGNVPPSVNAGPDRVVDEGDSVAFSGSANDPGVLDTLSYAWDLNYVGGSFTPDVIGPTASTIYTDGPATIVAALRVRDKDGGQTMDTVNVTVGNLSPSILSVANDGPVGEGSPLTLVVNAVDSGNDVLTYDFDWGNDGVFDAVNQAATVSHTWYNQGSYVVGIRVNDGDGGQVLTTTNVSAFNVSPVAVAGPPVLSLEGAPITFDGGGSNDPGVFDALAFEWNFGDGSPVVTGTTVSHIFADNNVYTTTLTVTDDSAAADTDLVAVTILNANPVADAGPDRTLNEGQQLNLTGVASDPGIADLLNLAWDLDYDGTNFTEDSFDPSVSLIYPDGPASYMLAFRVRDDDYPFPTGEGGEVGEMLDLVQVTVNNVPPSVNAGGPYYDHPAQPVTLAGTAVDVPADTLAYSWDLDANGTYEVSGPSVITSWNTADIYTVTLRVIDDDGGIGLNTVQVNIGNQDPVAEAGGPYSGDEGTSITLTGSGSDLEGDPLTYIWDLNYDSIFETPGQVVTNTWPDDGIYTVTLRVDDGWGGVATDTATVVVRNVPPIVSANGPYVATVGVPVVLSGSGLDVPNDPLAFTWYVDDGGMVAVPGQVIAYTWITSGTYTVILEADDGDGGVSTDATTVDVSTIVPLAWLGSLYFLTRGKRAGFCRRKVIRNGWAFHHCRRKPSHFT